MLVQTTDFLGIKLLELLSCSSIDDCHDKKAKLDSGDFVISDFSFTVGASALSASGASSGFFENGVCSEGQTTRTVLVADGDTITVTQQITNVPDYPAEADMTCSTDGAEAAADGQACSQQQTMTAHFVEAL